jgi:hypothetical protein
MAKHRRQPSDWNELVTSAPESRRPPSVRKILCVAVIVIALIAPGVVLSLQHRTGAIPAGNGATRHTALPPTSNGASGPGTHGDV